MIIGISGKKQSGKDTVGKIIQGFDIYRTNKKVQHDYSFNNHFVRDYVLGKVNPFPSSYEIKKFAGKLKQIVSIITGYSLEELEQDDIKNKVLFQSYELRNTKAETAEVFESMEVLINRLDFLREMYSNNYSKEELFEIFQQKTIDITPRLLLQKIGTDIGREINPNIWVNSLMSEYKPYLTSNYPVDDLDWEPRRIYPNWIITDTRFPNETEAIKEKEGILIRLNREGIENDNHFSETALDNYTDFNYIIDNNNCIECLIEKVKEILKHEKII